MISIAPDGKPAEAQPQWRQDFPIDWAQDNYVARRDFTKFMVLTSLAFVVGQFWILVQNFLRARKGEPLTQPIAKIDDLAIGKSLVFNYPDEHEPCLLVRTGEDRFVAFSQK